MKHHIASFHGRLYAMGVADIAGKDIELIPFFFLQCIQPSPMIERVIEHKGLYLMSIVDQAFHQMTADKSISAGNKDFLAFQIHPYSTPSAQINSSVSHLNLASISPNNRECKFRVKAKILKAYSHFGFIRL